MVVFLHSSRCVLLNYAVFNPEMGYCQGMSDLVAPLLTEVQDESDTFWCFVGLMENTIFISSPRDEDMERQLVRGQRERKCLFLSLFITHTFLSSLSLSEILVFVCVALHSYPHQCPNHLSPLFQMYLRELLRLMLPRFHQHLTQLGEDGLQLLFCHRWILLCFKREFPDTEALRMWEACWAHYQVRNFTSAYAQQHVVHGIGVHRAISNTQHWHTYTNIKQCVY